MKVIIAKESWTRTEFVNSVPALRDLLKSLEDVIQFDFIIALPSEWLCSDNEPNVSFSNIIRTHKSDFSWYWKAFQRYNTKKKEYRAG